MVKSLRFVSGARKLPVPDGLLRRAICWPRIGRQRRNIMPVPDETAAYRVTRSGDMNTYRITNGGAYRVVYTQPAPVPVSLIQVLRVRGMIYDPLVNDIFFVETLPDNPPDGMAFTRGDGNYLQKQSGEWERLPIKFTDAGIEDMIAIAGDDPIAGAALLIDRLIARIQPEDYLTSGNAGGQSLSFPTLAELLAFYKGLKDSLKEEAAALAHADSGLMLRTRKRFVGGVMEEDEPWA